MGSQHNGVHRLLHLGCQRLHATGLCHGRFGLLSANCTAAWQQLFRSRLVHRNSSAFSTCSPVVDSSSSSSSSGQTLQPGVLQQQCNVAGKQWMFETGRLAKLAHGSCVVSVGGTSVLATAVVDPTPQPEADGVPLQVEYRERLSAVGRLPARPDRRDRVGSEREVLAGRLIDRALRPLMPPGFLYDTQVWCQVLSADGAIQPEVVAINAASAALLLAPHIPFTYPVGAVRVTNRRGRVAFNPSVASEAAGQATQLGLTYAGTPTKATAMEATAAQVSEANFIATMRMAAQATQPLIQAQLELAAAAADRNNSVTGSYNQNPGPHLQQHYHLDLLWPSRQVQQAVDQLMRQPLRELFSQHQQQQQSAVSSDKSHRAHQLAQLQRQLLADLRLTGLIADDQSAASGAGGAAAGLYSREEVLRSFDILQSRVMRELLLQSGIRIDGRRLDQVRPVSCEAGTLPRRVHGSGLFTRGETQSLATATVGQDRDVPQLESLFAPSSNTNAGSSSSSSGPLHLHYSFPAFSVGEIGKSGAPNRREIGHGNLARTGLLGIMPAARDFPFTVRVTADTLGSSGSSSMAAVCAGSLALKTAGVPVQALAAGISVGLMTQQPPQLAGAARAGLIYQQQQHQQNLKAPPAAASSSDSCDVLDYSSIVSKGPVQQDVQQQPTAAGEGEEEQVELDNSCDSINTSCSVGQVESDAAIRAADCSHDGISSSGAGSHILNSSYGSAVLLTDIQGIEDHHGDMDFKVAGTTSGITAVQLDTKLPGIDLHLLEAALPAAAAAKRDLLEQMTAAIGQYEEGLTADDAPEFGTVQILKDLVPRLIGPQGQTLLQIEDSCGATLIVEDSGTITVYAPTQHQYQHALAAVQEIEGRGVQAGEVYKVRVLRLVDFGAYVSLPNGLPALLHISEVSHEKVREMRDVLTEGDEFEVVCKGRDAKGFVRLSRKDLLPHPETGHTKTAKAARTVEDKEKKKDVPRMDTWQPS